MSNQIFDLDVARGNAGIDLFLEIWYAFEPVICLFVDPHRLTNQYCPTLRQMGSYKRQRLMDKYQAVNIKYATDKTPTHIEIRLHHATTDKEEIYNWICLLVLLFSKCLYYSNNRAEYETKIKLVILCRKWKRLKDTLSVHSTFSSTSLYSTIN